MSYAARKDREDELEKLRQTHVCQVCGNPLVMPYDPARHEVVLRCGKDKSHVGIIKQKSLYQLYKEGVGMALEIAQKFQDMEEKRNK